MLIDTNDERFWDILFNEACVEGRKAVNIERELKEIAISEESIKQKAQSEILKEVCQIISQKLSGDTKHLTGSAYHKELAYIEDLRMIEQLKEDLERETVQNLRQTVMSM